MPGSARPDGKPVGPQWFTVSLNVRLLPQQAAQFGHELRDLLYGAGMARDYQFDAITIKPVGVPDANQEPA